jgi:hypothetical protein
LGCHATSVAPLSGNEQRLSEKNSVRTNWHGGCNDKGMKFVPTYRCRGAGEAGTLPGLSVFGQSLPMAGQ